MRHPVAALSLVLAVTFLPAAAARAEEGGDTLAYKVEVRGLGESGLDARVNAVSRLVTLADHPPPGLIALQQRADDDRQRLDDLLRSQGYYDGSIEVAVDGAVAPAQVTVTITPGPRTLLDAWEVDPPQGIDPGEVGLQLGQPALADTVVKAESRLLALMAERSHPLAKVVERRVVVDHAAHAMRVTERLDPGPWVVFGPVAITGLRDLDPDYVRRRIPWHEGEPFSPASVERLRKTLADSALFRTIRIDTTRPPDAAGRLPVTIDLAERAGHSVGAGVWYSTDEGPGVQTFWEDRNLFGGAEKLRLTGAVSRVRELALADYRAPDYFGPNVDQIGTLSFDQHSSSAFFTRTAGVTAGADWRLSPIWDFQGSTAFEHTIDHESDNPVHHYDLASLPLQARRDTTNDVLDPTGGGRTTLTLRPFVNVTGDTRPFTRVEARQTVHWQLIDDPRLVLAGWGDVGTFVNGARTDIPADKRFYAGGGGSVRGYRLYYAGPLDSQGRPTGGRSLLATGAELRLRITDDIGIAPFFEGAQVSADTWPGAADPWFWGGGLGLRYYTPIGPLRLDVAVPTRRRPGIDAPYQIYVSLGQAF